MKHNVGNIDKVVRIIIGLGLLSLIFILQGNIRWLGLIGLLPLLTVTMSWCPAYTLFNISTKSK